MSADRSAPAGDGSAIRSVLWVGLSRYGNFAISLVVLGLLARLLSPADFGLVAMVSIVTGFMQVLAHAGTAQAVVQHTEWDDVDLSTVFWQTLAFGGALFALLWVGAPWLAAFFGEARITALLRVAGVGFWLTALGRVPQGLLQQRLQFRRLAGVDLTGSIAGGITGVVAALAGAGAWTLLVRELTIHAIRLAGAMLVSEWRPRMALRMATFHTASRYGGSISAFTALTYWSRNADNLLVGARLGAEQLGFYTRAYALMMYPLELLTGIINPVLHPALLRHRGDTAAMARAWLDVARFVSLVCLPLMTGLAVCAAEAIAVVWGPRWEASVPVFLTLCAVGAVQPVLSIMGPVYMARDMARALLVVGIGVAVTLVTGIAVGLHLGGLLGCARGFAVAYFVMGIPSTHYFLRRVLEATWADFGAVHRTGLVSAAAVAALSLALRPLLLPMGLPLLTLLGCALPSVLVWVLLTRRLERAWLQRMATMLPPSLGAVLRRLTR